MSASPRAAINTAENSFHELNIRYVVLRILLEDLEKPGSQSQACSLVERYLTYALEKYGNEISPDALQLGSPEDLRRYFCDCVDNLDTQESSKLKCLRILGEVIGECEAGIIAELDEGGLGANQFFEQLAGNSEFSPDEVSVLRQGRASGRFKCNKLRREAAHPMSAVPSGATQTSSSSHEAATTVNTRAGSTIPLSAVIPEQIPNVTRVLSPREIWEVIQALPRDERPELEAVLLDETRQFILELAFPHLARTGLAGAESIAQSASRSIPPATSGDQVPEDSVDPDSTLMTGDSSVHGEQSAQNMAGQCRGRRVGRRMRQFFRLRERPSETGASSHPSDGGRSR